MTLLIFILKVKPPVDGNANMDDIVDGLLSHVNALDSERKEMFHKWLFAHSSQVKQSGNIQEGLMTWFASMTSKSVQWEYYLLMREIKWLLDQSEENIVLLKEEYSVEMQP